MSSSSPEPAPDWSSSSKSSGIEAPKRRSSQAWNCSPTRDARTGGRGIGRSAFSAQVSGSELSAITAEVDRYLGNETSSSVALAARASATNPAAAESHCSMRVANSLLTRVTSDSCPALISARARSTASAASALRSDASSSSASGQGTVRSPAPRGLVCETGSSNSRSDSGWIFSR